MKQEMNGQYVTQKKWNEYFLKNPKNVTYHHTLNRHLRCSQRSNAALPCKIATVVLGPTSK